MGSLSITDAEIYTVYGMCIGSYTKFISYYLFVYDFLLGFKLYSIKLVNGITVLVF